MSERAKPTRSRGPLMMAAGLFIPAVCAGVVTGRAIPERESNEPTIAGPLSVENAPNERLELEACQKRLAARREAKATSSIPGIASSTAIEDAGRAATTIEQLELERTRCRKSEIVTSAEICAAAGRQFFALMALPKDGLRCGPKSRAADLIEENYERCAAFAKMLADIRSENLTKEESLVIAEAIRVQQTLKEDELLLRLKEFVRTCPDTPPKVPPGLKSNTGNGEQP